MMMIQHVSVTLHSPSHRKQRKVSSMSSPERDELDILDFLSHLSEYVDIHRWPLIR
jgi:hypothetical protein